MLYALLSSAYTRYIIKLVKEMRRTVYV